VNHNGRVVILDHHFQKFSDFGSVFRTSVHLAEAVADFVQQKFGLLLDMEGLDEPVYGCHFLEGTQTEKTVDSLGDGSLHVGK